MKHAYPQFLFTQLILPELFQAGPVQWFTGWMANNCIEFIM